MAKLKDWLDELGFDWEKGIILYQPVTKEASCPGWASEEEMLPTKIIKSNDPILIKTFSSNFGSPQCPRIWAKDGKAVYFPSQYDGSTSLEKVIIDPSYYLNGASTPYSGG